MANQRNVPVGESRGVSPIVKSVVILAISLFPLAQVIGNEVDVSIIESKSEERNDWQCSLYLAESVIPGSGLSVFTTRAYEAGDLLRIPAEVTVPISMNDYDDDPVNFNFMGSLRHYYWNSLVHSHHFTQHAEGRRWFDFAFGSGALPNHDVHYCNIEHPERGGVGTLVDDYHRANPGTDAYTPFHHLALGATEDIKEGGELFLDYGQDYFSFRDYGVYLSIPDHNSYNEAASLMKDFLSTKARRTETTKLTPNDVAAQDAESPPPSSLQMEWDVVIEHADNRTRSALPKDVNSVLVSNGTTFALEDATRSKEWLEANGECLDKYRIGASNIFEAGRGGFANTFIRKGEIISPYPVAQLNRTLQVLDSDSGISGSPRPSHRLLLNYCMGHPESTLLLCPYSNTMIFNHAPSSINCDNDDNNIKGISKPVANTKIQFSSSNMKVKKELFSMSAKDILDLPNTIGVLYELVATRDIAPNEEIFMNYGSAWEEAWNEHLKLWHPYVSNVEDRRILKSLISPEECNVDYSNVEDKAANIPLPDCLLHHKEIQDRIHNISRANPSHDVNTGCFYKPDWSAMPYLSWVRDDTQQDDFNMNQYRIIPWTFATEKEGTTGGLFPCQILMKEEQQQLPSTKNHQHENLELTYTVMILLDHNDQGYKMTDVDMQFVRNVPERAIRQITQAWRDHSEVDHFSREESYFPRPFRHYIGIPDEALPDSWRDVPSDGMLSTTVEDELHLKNQSIVLAATTNKNETDGRACDAINMDGIDCS